MVIEVVEWVERVPLLVASFVSTSDGWGTDTSARLSLLFQVALLLLACYCACTLAVCGRHSANYPHWGPGRQAGFTVSLKL
jgi:hypothetical protein